ncbi:MAG TPA: Rab family GTPase [Gemmatimonadaceae bacterium]|nr:Rab family GTPase [Gemmatimonadaceae bacterium]
MIQKKICMVGVYAVGKTCLVQRFVQGIFSVKYLSTVGVKIDRKQMRVGSDDLTLMLWDLEGRDAIRDVNASYVKGAHGVIYVADGTRPETLIALDGLRELVEETVGTVPSVVAMNKSDLADQWTVSPRSESEAGGEGLHRLRTSAKTGEGVEAAFQWLAEQTMNQNGEAR